ncbi:MAG: hypothetical protein QOJ82_2507 [Solirubrobacteraceae bacterium]|jgi:hypothetical protein|nr:hypothetical protein [Solirubrobacteraceae bacterium]
MSTWRERWAEQLSALGLGQVIVALEVGAEPYAQRDAASLGASGLRSRVLDLRDLGLVEKNADVSDYLNSGAGSRVALLSCLKQEVER